MLAANSGWIAGGYTAFQYNGTAWNTMDNGLAGLYLTRIAAVTPTNVWGVGLGREQREYADPLA